MSKYNWTTDNLEDRLKYIEKLSLKEEDGLKKLIYLEDIEYLKDTIDELNGENMGDMPKLMEFYKNGREILNDIKFLWSTYYDFCDLPSIDTDLEIKNQTLSKEDLLSLTHDFFRDNTNKFFFGNFMKSFYRNKDHIRFSPIEGNIYGNTIAIDSLKEQFIDIKRDYTINDLITCIHEYMHATSHNISPIHLHANKWLYKEIDPIFMELVATDYLENQFKNGQATISKVHDFNSYKDFSDIISGITNIVTKESATKKITKNKELRTMASEYDLDDLDLLIGLDNINSLNVNYLTDYLYAIELHKIYKEDREKALNILKKIILLFSDSDEKYYNEIKTLGLMPSTNTRKYRNNMEENVQKLTLKKQNYRTH